MDDEPLDFEKEDKLLSTLRPANKRRKVIRLDDLLKDFYSEKKNLVECQPKHSAFSKNYNSDEEDERTQKLSELVSTCQRQFDGMDAEDEIPSWGLRVFGPQKPFPSISNEGLGRSQLLQPLLTCEFSSDVDLSDEQGESFLEGLLANRWLSKLALISGFIEDSVANWTFNKMLYSSNGELQLSACEFWCEILLSKNEAHQPSVLLRWFPNYCMLKDALEIYGCLSDSSDCSWSRPQASCLDPGSEGPPENIISWIKVISACCQIRSVRAIFSSSEAEDLLVVIIRLFLDRELQGLSFHLNECLLSILSFFSEEEWEVSSQKVAESVAHKIPKNLNCLRAVECVTAVNSRSRKLRSEVALQVLMVCFDKKYYTKRFNSRGPYSLLEFLFPLILETANNFEEILELLVTINVKDKDCDFFKLFLYLVLGENILLSYCPSPENSVIYDMWCKYLRSCSSQITSTDWRSYASKVRNKASYLLQSTINRN